MRSIAAPCNEDDSWSNLQDTAGSMHFTAHNRPGATAGFCQGGRWPEYDKWLSRGRNAVFNPYSVSGTRSLFPKDGEHELLLLPDRLVFRVASNAGGGAWDKVSVPH